MIQNVYLAGGVRTPIGAFRGALEPVSATELGGLAVKVAIARSGVNPELVNEVVFGNVLSAGLGQNVARQVSIGAGLSVNIGATTVNKVCGSGLKAVVLAAQSIQCGDASVVVAGGTESMSRAPYLLERVRNNHRTGHRKLIDSVIRDGLWDVYSDVHTGACADRFAANHDFTREQQDDYAMSSYERAFEASRLGIFDKEIVQVETLSKGDSIGISEDEGMKRSFVDKMRVLKPLFGKDGTVTSGNSASHNDGAAAVVVLSEAKVQAMDLQPQAKILGYACASVEPESFPVAPVHALRRLLEKLSLSIEDVDLFEISETFSVVPLITMKKLSIPHEKVNVHGGAVALGHPLGAGGARTLVTLLNAMKHREAHIGVNVLCIGGGEAVAMAVERC